MSETIDVQITDDPRAVIVKVVGNISLACVDAFDVQVNKVAARRPKLVVFDMAGVSSIPSLAMRSLISLNQSVRRTTQGRVVLAGLQLPVRRAFEMARLDQLFGMEEGVEAAITRYAS